MSQPFGYLLVFLGAGAGGAIRHGVNRLALVYGAAFPWWTTLVVNVSGCFLMGVLAGWLVFRGDANQPARLFLTTGLLGGFTTFSAFALDAAVLWNRGDAITGASYVVVSVALSLGAVFIGLTLMR